MSKLSSKGFTGLESILILAVLTAICAIGYFAYNNINSSKKTTTDQTVQQEPETSDPAGPPEASELQPYNNAKLGFAFDYPKSWKAVETLEGDKLSSVALYSANYKELKYENGTSDTVEGAVITVYPAVAYTGTEPDQFVGLEKSLLDNGTIKLEHGTIGNFSKTLQYSYAYEGPETFYARLPFRGQTYVQTSLQSEGSEANSEYWNTYSYTVGSIR